MTQPSRNPEDPPPVRDEAAIEEAAALLRRGELVAIPTETVYGLAADARNDAAIARVFEVKGRPSSHPVIVHFHDAAALEYWVAELPAAATALAERFWPGPLTLVLKRRAGVSDAITGGQDTVALRVPSHPVSRALLERFGGGVIAPSANRFGHVSPTRPEHVVEELGSSIALVLDGGPCQVGVESTIVSLVGERPRLLRPGMVLPAEIEACLGTALGGADDGTRAPGTLPSHYAPRTPVDIVDGEGLRAALGRNVAVFAFQTAPSGEQRVWITAPMDPERYAAALYAALRELDGAGAARILVERPPAEDAWIAIHDRLRRAAWR